MSDSIGVDIDRSEDMRAATPSSVFETEVRDQQTRRNALVSPLCRRTDDILVPIINFTQLRPHFHPFWKPPEATRWIQIMSACTRIRTLIVQTPSLWCFIDIQQPQRWTDLCLQRSLDHPLEVYLSLNDKDDDVGPMVFLLERSSAAWVDWRGLAASTSPVL